MHNRVDVTCYNRHVGGWGSSDTRQINTKLQKPDPATPPLLQTSLLSLVIFGGLAWLFAAWPPKVAVGFWDYAQMLIRMGISLVLIIVGWLFWMLSLARLSSPPAETSPP